VRTPALSLLCYMVVMPIYELPNAPKPKPTADQVAQDFREALADLESGEAMRAMAAAGLIVHLLPRSIELLEENAARTVER